ncbi:MAG: amidohydrolase family protein [bacterium]|nr:amidohydrolase family protein [bacterium]
MNRDRYQFRLQRLLGAAAIGAACFTASADSSTAEAESVETKTNVTTQKADAIDVLVIYAGKVTTMDGDDRVINNAVVVVEDGKIVEVRKAKGYKEPKDAEVIDARDSWLVPGIVELHNHTAGALRDLNDSVYLTNPGLRTLEIVAPETEEVRRAQVGGVTAAMLIPGSGTNMSGFGTLVKMGGSSVDEVVMRAPGSIKIAQAGNPEGYWFGVGRSFMNYNTRQTLEEAKAYHEAWVAYENGESEEKPEYSIVFDDFRGLFAREYPATVHTQAYQLVMTTIDMLANKLGIRVVLDHSTIGAFRTAQLVAEAGEENVITMVGPRALYFDRMDRRIFGEVARWHLGGVNRLGINTDAPVVPQEELTNQAALAVWLGWEPYKALRGLTIVGAEAAMAEDQIGSIEAGKDADFGIWTGNPVDPTSWVKMTIVNGKVVYDAERDGRRF